MTKQTLTLNNLMTVLFSFGWKPAKRWFNTKYSWAFMRCEDLGLVASRFEDGERLVRAYQGIMFGVETSRYNGTIRDYVKELTIRKFAELLIEVVSQDLNCQSDVVSYLNATKGKAADRRTRDLEKRAAKRTAGINEYLGYKGV